MINVKAGSVTLQNVRKTFGAFTAIPDLSLTIEPGTLVTLLGPSGCGKTTTLRMIAGLELPSSGAIILGGEDVAMRRARERDIAFVFQLFALYPHMNVRKNIGFPLLAQGLPFAEIRSRVEETARLLRADFVIAHQPELLDRAKVIGVPEPGPQVLVDRPILLGRVRAEFRREVPLEVGVHPIVVEQRVVDVQQKHDGRIGTHWAFPGGGSTTGLFQPPAAAISASASFGPQLPTR